MSTPQFTPCHECESVMDSDQLKRAQKAQPVSHANKLPDDDAFLRAARALNYNLYIAHADSNSEVSNEELADAIRAAMKGDE